VRVLHDVFDVLRASRCAASCAAGKGPAVSASASSSRCGLFVRGGFTAMPIKEGAGEQLAEWRAAELPV
jgi:hypothetical protein